MGAPHTHYLEVEMVVSKLSGKTLDVKMPVWAPGSYMVREFARNVDFFEATADGKKLPWKKTDKNTWSIATNGSKEIRINYNVYAFEMSVRTSFLDDSHGYINGTSVFMYVKDKKNLSGKLTIEPHKNFKSISTGLTYISNQNGKFQYSFPDYDFLADCPIEIGNQEIFSFNASGIEHEVAMYGEGNYDKERLKQDMAKVVESCTKVFGENPNQKYVFIIHNLTVGSGGLEHLNSTTLQVNRWTYSGSAYTDFLSLVAHEYFHLWNVKRIRADVLGPFDYDKENYSTLLWVLEGFTSYYDELLLLRSGFHTQSEYLSVLSRIINTVENTPGAKIQSASESSFDAWIKGYRTNENSVNSQISYYTKGQLLGALLDIEIIQATNGSKRLDDLLSYLYQEFYKKQKRGFSDVEFRKAAEKIAGKELKIFFEEYVEKTTAIDYEKYFAPLGMTLKKTSREKEIAFGARLTDSGGKLIVKEVTKGTSSYESGLNVNDEIISCNGFRVDQTSFNKMIAASKIGDEIDLLISRDNIMQALKIKLLPNGAWDHQVTVLQSTGENQEKLRMKWLGN